MADESAPTEAPRVHIRTCPLCEATCGLELTLTDQDAVKVIRGDRDDVFSRGFVCPKGTTLHRLHTDPDRLRTPLVRRRTPDGGSELTEATWDEAFTAVAEGLGAVRSAHGPNAVAAYLGNPNAHGHHNVIFGRPALKALGTRNIFSASTVDQMPKHVSSGLMFGNALTIAVPDLDRTDHLLLLGANPLESNGSLCTAPDFPGRLAAIMERGGEWSWSTPDAPARPRPPASTSPSGRAPTPCCWWPWPGCCSRRASPTPGPWTPTWRGPTGWPPCSSRSPQRRSPGPRASPGTRSAGWPASWPRHRPPRCTAASAPTPWSSAPSPHGPWTC